jgi:hypothetical protein
MGQEDTKDAELYYPIRKLQPHRNRRRQPDLEKGVVEGILSDPPPLPQTRESLSSNSSSPPLRSRDRRSAKRERHLDRDAARYDRIGIGMAAKGARPLDPYEERCYPREAELFGSTPIVEFKPGSGPRRPSKDIHLDDHDRCHQVDLKHYQPDKVCIRPRPWNQVSFPLEQLYNSPSEASCIGTIPSSVDGYLSSSMKDPFCHSTPPYRTPPPTTALFGYFRLTHLAQPNEGYTMPKSTLFNSSKSGGDRLLPRSLEKSFRTRILVIISMFCSSVQTGIL